MTSKGRQQPQNESLSSSPPDHINSTISSTLPSVELPSSLSQPINEQTSEDRPWTNRATHFEHPNDRFIHETVPPTAHSVLRTQPAFIGKLYKMLEDDTQNLICWSSNGEYFSVYNSALFSKQILPQYFKHNNWQSFVRQLNMYGFSKINEMIHSNISFENQTWDFKHPHFKRGDLQSLVLVKRKSVKAPGSLLSHLNIASPSSAASHYHHHHNHLHQAKEGEMDSTTFPNAPSSSHSEIISIDEEVRVENRVMQMDHQVLQVSQSVTNLTSEMQDIKSLIYNQQSMIHDLADLLRSCQNASAATSTSPSSVIAEETQQRTTSLPSIHNLANNLRHAANIDTSGSPQHQQPYPYTSMPDTIQSFPATSPKSSPPHQDSKYPPHSDDFHPQQRRSSHPSSNNSQNRSPHSLYPLLNSTIDRNNSPYTQR